MFKQTRKLTLASAIALATLAMSNTASADDITEARQEAQIWTTYLLSPYLRAHDIQVTVDDGEATLTGKVDEDVNRDLAKQIALGVSGIKKVDNQIVVMADYEPPKRSERTYGEVVDDASITAAVKSKLVWSKYIDSQSINVETNSGKVILKGSADSNASRDLAKNLAMNTRGVTSVDNQLTVDDKKPKSVEQVISDTWITTKVKSTFMYSDNVSNHDIAVTTSNGIVTLTGKVDSGAEHALAIEFAQNVRGVKSVNATGLVH
jgi:hyperosmotically inducible protein